VGAENAFIGVKKKQSSERRVNDHRESTVIEGFDLEVTT
jgi:hypothetical protein